MNALRQWLGRIRDRLEGLDFALHALRAGCEPGEYDAMRRREGLTPFRKAWWLHTRLECYGTLRRYARLLDRVSRVACRVSSCTDPRLPNIDLHPTPDTRHPTPDTRYSSRVLIFRMGHLGDLIHLMPAVREMRRQRPDWQVELITGPWNRELVERYDLFNAIHYWTPDVVQFHRGNRKEVLTVKKEREWVEALRNDGVDMVFCPSSPHFCELPVMVGLRPRMYVGGEWGLPPGLLGIHKSLELHDNGSDQPSNGGRRRGAPPFSRIKAEDVEGRALRARSREMLGARVMEVKTLPFNSRHYEMDAVGDFLPLMGLERPELKLFFPVSESAREQVAEWVSGVAGRVSGVGCRVSGEEVHDTRGEAGPLQPPSTKDQGPGTKDTTAPLALLFPGSGWPGKNWPAERFAELGDWLVQEQKMSVGIGGAPAERELCERVTEMMRQPATVWAGKLTLAQSAALIERAAMVIGNDSAAIHMAAALGVSTVSLWGPTYPEKWAPRGGHHQSVVRKGPCASCVYWHRRAVCGGTPPCMTTIDLERVRQAVSAGLACAS